MRTLLEQAGASRQTAIELRRHATDLHAPDLIVSLKLAERLEARAATLEYQWLTIDSSLTLRHEQVSTWRRRA